MKKFKYLWIPAVLIWVAAAAWVLLRALPSWQAKESCLAGNGVWISQTQSCKYPEAPAVPTDDGAPSRQPH